MNFPLFIAKRIFASQDAKQKVSKPAIRIATAGVAIGLAVMIISVSVVLGFKHTVQNKVIGSAAIPGLQNTWHRRQKTAKR